MQPSEHLETRLLKYFESGEADLNGALSNDELAVLYQTLVEERALTAEHHPERLRDPTVGTEPPGLGPEAPAEAPETTDEWTMKITPSGREFTFRITARPWSGNGVRPFDCDFYAHPPSTENREVDDRMVKGTLVFAPAPDAVMEDDYWQNMGPSYSHVRMHSETQLKLIVVRV